MSTPAEKTAPMALLISGELADAACCMDWLRRELVNQQARGISLSAGTAEALEESQHRIDMLHDLAACAAGERVNEIYSPAEKVEAAA